MFVGSWNVNSVGARLPLLEKFLQDTAPDILVLQELKCETEKFPHTAMEALGYKAYVLGQKSYNGVAILSKQPLQNICTQLVGFEHDEQARFISADAPWGKIINIYAPNGNPVFDDVSFELSPRGSAGSPVNYHPKFTYKLAWLKALVAYCQNLLQHNTPFLVLGDFNIIPEPLDAANPQEWLGDAQFQPQARGIYRQLIYMGLTDAFRALHPHTADYSFWDYQAGAWPRNNGIRIDHVLLSPYLADKLQNCAIDRTPRAWEKPSDHTPIVVSLGV
jgi:exodeoxyribonuclease III